MISLNPVNIREYVRDVHGRYFEIEHKAWNGSCYTRSSTEMWIEASQIVPQEWREIIRVLAQGGEYYSIEWAAVAPEVLKAEAERIQGLINR